MATSFRFAVEAETAPGRWVNVHNGNDRTEAERVCNFWDERVNVKFIDQVMVVIQEQLIAEAEVERIANLPLDEQFAHAQVKIEAAIDKSFKAAIAKLETV